METDNDQDDTMKSNVTAGRHHQPTEYDGKALDESPYQREKIKHLTALKSYDPWGVRLPGLREKEQGLAPIKIAELVVALKKEEDQELKD